MNQEYCVTVKIFLDVNRWGAVVGENPAPMNQCEARIRASVGIDKSQ